MAPQPQRQYTVPPGQAWVAPKILPPMQVYNGYQPQSQYLPDPPNTQAAYLPGAHKVCAKDISSAHGKQPSLPAKRKAPSDHELLKELELAYGQVYKRSLELETKVERLQAANTELAKEQGQLRAAAQQCEEQLRGKSQDVELAQAAAQHYKEQLGKKHAALRVLRAITQRKELEHQKQAEQLRKLQVAAEQHEGQLRQKDAEMEQLRHAAQRWQEVKPKLLQLRAQQAAKVKREVVGSSSAPLTC
ncbi:hypothetical protein N2152v2_007783 [Parachlorella kessleri]